MHTDQEGTISDGDSVQRRLVTLESSLAYLQHDYTQLNGVVLEQQQLIQKLQREIERLQEQLPLSPQELPAPLDDTPPHY